MIVESEIREKLGRFLSKEISLDQFEDWLVQRSWNMHEDSPEAAQKLVASIELRLAEHSSGHLDEGSLHNELRPLVTIYTMQISFGAAVPVVAQESPNNLTARADRPQVVSFPSRWAASAPQGATVFVDTSRAVELA